MDLSSISEFAEEYQDWLAGKDSTRSAWCEVPVSLLDPEPRLAISPDTLLGVALASMNELERSAALVVSGEQLVGLLSEREILRWLGLGGLDLDSTTAAEVMTCDAEVLTDSTSVAQALCTIVRSPHGHLPVIDASGRPIGIVSMRRILEFVNEALAKDLASSPAEPKSGVFAFDGG